MSNKAEVILKLEAKYKELAELRKEMVSIAKADGIQEVSDYSFHDKKGRKLSLSQMFGRHDELILIHNMGKGCVYCTLWADGLSSSTWHLSNRCAFGLVSPDEWEKMYYFGEPREWEFPYYSAAGNTFTQDMGFAFQKQDGKMSYSPGFTTFVKKDGKIYRVACDVFGPGDFYSPIWHMMDMLHYSDKPWSPQYEYPYEPPILATEN